jgi:hypothetical protein
MYPLNKLEIPTEVAQQNGPFEEFKQDVSIVTVELVNGVVYERVMLLYPNYVIAVAEQTELPFDPSKVVSVTQRKSKNRKFKDSTWCFWYDHNQVV